MQEEISAALKVPTMVFVTCGMGGGTGTGATPVITYCKRTKLTVGVVTKPFRFESKTRRYALAGIEKLKRKCGYADRNSK